MHRTLIRSAAVGATALAAAGLAGGVAAAAGSAAQATVFRAQLKESGGAAKSASSASFVGRLNGKTMHYTITYKGLKGTPHAASIQVAKSGSTSALTVPLTGKLTASPVTGTVTPSAALLSALRHGTAIVWLKAANPTSALSGAAKA